MNALNGSILTTDDSKVKVIFVPTYLNKADGIFNKDYYELLVGMDITVFPSYYEPWGYTPLESVAFSVPTITTTLAGFGLWVDKQREHLGVEVIRRDDYNDKAVEEPTRCCASARWTRSMFPRCAFRPTRYLKQRFGSTFSPPTNRPIPRLSKVR